MKRSLVFPILLFSSISLHWSLRKTFLSLLSLIYGVRRESDMTEHLLTDTINRITKNRRESSSSSRRLILEGSRMEATSDLECWNSYIRITVRITYMRNVEKGWVRIVQERKSHMKKFQDRENYGKLWNSSGLVSYVYEK